MSLLVGISLQNQWFKQNRVTFEPFNSQSVRCHNTVTALIIKILSKIGVIQSGIISLKTWEGRILHLNKNSLDSWIKKTSKLESNVTSLKLSDYAQAVNFLCRARKKELDSSNNEVEMKEFPKKATPPLLLENIPFASSSACISAFSIEELLSPLKDNDFEINPLLPNFLKADLLRAKLERLSEMPKDLEDISSQLSESDKQSFIEDFEKETVFTSVRPQRRYSMCENTCVAPSLKQRRHSISEGVPLAPLNKSSVVKRISLCKWVISGIGSAIISASKSIWNWIKS